MLDTTLQLDTLLPKLELEVWSLKLGSRCLELPRCLDLLLS
jgi:hypothetical protein